MFRHRANAPSGRGRRPSASCTPCIRESAVRRMNAEGSCARSLMWNKSGLEGTMAVCQDMFDVARAPCEALLPAIPGLTIVGFGDAWLLCEAMFPATAFHDSFESQTEMTHGLCAKTGPWCVLFCTPLSCAGSWDEPIDNANPDFNVSRHGCENLLSAARNTFWSRSLSISLARFRNDRRGLSISHVSRRRWLSLSAECLGTFVRRPQSWISCQHSTA